MRCEAFLVAATLLVTSCRKEKQPEPVVQAVRVGAVQQIQPDVLERYSTSIEPLEKVELAFKSGGIIEGILQVRGADDRMRNVAAGDKVAKDAALAQVRPLDYQHTLEQAEAQRAQAEAQVAHAQAELVVARANFNTAQIEFTRASNLFQSASLVKPQYDQAKGRYDADAASVVAAEDAVKAAQEGLAKARAAVSEAKLSLSDTTLRAPFAGWISARNVDRGSLVSSSTVGFSIIDTHLVKAVFGVPDSSLSMIRLGQKQPVLVDALQRTVPGVITSISPNADPQTRVFSVEVTLENSREQIRPGMIGSITLSASRDLRPRLVVPLSAVVRAPADPNGFAVFRLTERGGQSYASAQTIGIGQTFGNSIEVTHGLTAGQKIITLGGALLRDGEQVRVLP
jgi:RND family efflux transporter MFP subunit